jgi:hypothetical protein
MHRLHTGLFTTLLFASSCFVSAEPASISQFRDCFSGNDTARAQKLNVSTVYAQILNPDSDDDRRLNLTVVGDSGQVIVGQAGLNLGKPVRMVNTVHSLTVSIATLFVNSEILTFDVYQTSQSFCKTLRAPTFNASARDNVTDYCPIGPGPFALSSYIPLKQSYELVTIDTRLRGVDPYTDEIFCVDIPVTPLTPGVMGSVYGHAVLIMWCSIALAIAYWAVVGLARIVGAWDRGQSRVGQGLWSRIEGSGYVVASAISGERFASSPSLMRFCKQAQVL